MKRATVLFATVLAACLVGPLAARAQDPSILTLERIYASGDFRGQFFAAGSWLSDGSGYLTFERSEEVDGGRDIVRHDPETGATDVLVPAARLFPADAYGFAGRRSCGLPAP